MAQNLSKLDITEKYFRNLQTGAIIPVYRNELAVQVELDNQNLIKTRRKDLIEFEVITRKDMLGLISVGSDESETPEYIPPKKVGNKKK
jgi:hypothetical protein